MKWFYDLSISKKLFLSFGISILMTLLIGVFVIVELRRNDANVQEVSSRSVPVMQSLADLRADLGEFRNYQLAMLDPDLPAEKLAFYTQGLDRLEKEMSATAATYKQQTAGDGELETLSGVANAAGERFFDAHARILQAVKAGDTAAAREISNTDARDSRRSYAESLKELADISVERLSNQANESGAISHRSIHLAIMALALAVLISAVLAWFITRSLTVPLRRAIDVSRQISSGHLDTAILSTSDDETGQLLSSMRLMQERLTSVMAALRDMAHRHNAGEISFRMEADQFPGAYGMVVHDINDVVAAHIAVKLRLVEIMQRYAVGDLSEDMDRLPGEKAVLTRTMDVAKSNLAAINAEIQRLSFAAAAGDFSVRGNEEQFQHEFRSMIAHLNSMMDASDTSLHALSELLKAVADGDLTHRMHGEFQGVFARMRDDANVTVERLTGIVGRIQQSTGLITVAAGEVAAGSQDLSRRTEQQAANLEETAASMEELTSTVRQNAEHARQADETAQAAGKSVQQTAEAISDVVKTMGQINESSRRIADIITVIDGIAFQTNILALNAAVEAARAGEQGRGFAVVASEVRTLAQRSATAAREIRDLILESSQRVEAGLEITSRSEQIMRELVAAAGKTNDLVNEIAAASAEQALGIEQVGQAIVQMDETTQQNAALVEEATAAARSMEEQAQELAAAASAFRISSTGGGAVVPVAVAKKSAPSPLNGVGGKVVQIRQPLSTKADWEQF